uniref:Putative secreted protein n=1 Tax=Anopheles triannulatus TaxID=58253 RepID=A0A2M4B2Z6_9DIPT
MTVGGGATVAPLLLLSTDATMPFTVIAATAGTTVVDGSDPRSGTTMTTGDDDGAPAAAPAPPPPPSPSSPAIAPAWPAHCTITAAAPMHTTSTSSRGPMMLVRKLLMLPRASQPPPAMHQPRFGSVEPLLHRASITEPQRERNNELFFSHTQPGRLRTHYALLYWDVLSQGILYSRAIGYREPGID